MNCLRFVCAAFVTSVAGCSLPLIGGGSSAATKTMPALAVDTVAVAPPIVQVREFGHSAVISVVAWDSEDAEFGLRTSVSRTGELVGGRQLGDHRLYVTPWYAREMGGFKYASVTFKELLGGTGAQRDPYFCFYGKDCSPLTSVGVRVPDALLRANRDSLVVTFFPRVQGQWTITLRRELIAAYLAKVDSVVAAVSKTHTM